jgi:peptide/nickel transport system permease protein
MPSSILVSSTPSPAALRIPGAALAPLRRLWRTNKFAAVGAVIGIVYLLLAALGPLIVTADPNKQDIVAQLRPPSAGHLFGTDNFGRDIFTRTIDGARLSISIALASVGIATVIGVALGVSAAYYGGWIDQVIMRAVDLVISFPSLILFIIVIAVFGSGIQYLILALSVGYTPAMARITRGSVLSVMHENYILAAQALGDRDVWIILKQVIPNMISPVIVQLTLNLPGVIFAEAGLSFIGLGPPPPAPSWGRMISDGRDYMLLAIWPVLFPGIAITLAVLGMNFLGDGIRDLLDPRYRNLLD